MINQKTLKMIYIHDMIKFWEFFCGYFYLEIIIIFKAEKWHSHLLFYLHFEG